MRSLVESSDCIVLSMYSAYIEFTATISCHRSPARRIGLAKLSSLISLQEDMGKGCQPITSLQQGEQDSNLYFPLSRVYTLSRLCFSPGPKAALG